MKNAYKRISAGSAQKSLPPLFFKNQDDISLKRERTQTSQIKLTSSPLRKLLGSGVCLEIQINAS